MGSDFLEDEIRIEAWISGTGTEEPEVALNVVFAGWPCWDNGGLGRGARAVCSSVTGGAIDPDAFEADGPLGESDRRFLAFFPSHSQRGVTARPGQFVGE